MADLVERLDESGVRTITLNNPRRLNALSTEMADELYACVKDASVDSSVRVVVLTGAGRAFCAGGDLAEGPAGGVAGDEGRERLREQVLAAWLLYSMDKPTIAAVNGVCAGAGFSLACAADIRIADPNATFHSGYLRAGVSGDFGITWLLPRLIGRSRALATLLADEPLNAAEAYSSGLVAQVSASGEALPTAHQLAAKLATGPRTATAYLKANVNDAPTTRLREHLLMEADRLHAAAELPDALEATQAFLEKRDPRFSQ